jgi:hypothetical protein
MKSSGPLLLVTAISTLFGASLLAIPTTAQVGSKTRGFSIDGITGASLDRLGELYLVLRNGSIRKYDTLGNFLRETTTPGSQNVTLLEPWNPLRIFVYSKEKNQITLLDHNLGVLNVIPVDPAWAIDPVLACPGTLNSFWVLDRSDLSLKWIDSKTKAVQREMPLSLPLTGKNPDFVFMREYQNLLFLVDRNSGIFIVNTIGKLVNSIAVPGLSYVGFSGEDFYYLQNGKIKFIDLYNEGHQEFDIEPAQVALATDLRLFVIRGSAVEVRDFRH